MKLRILLLISTFVLGVGFAMSDEGLSRSPGMLEKSVRSAISEAPDSYIVAVVKVETALACPEESGKVGCCLRVRVNELLGGHGPWPRGSGVEREFLLWSGANDGSCHTKAFEGRRYLLLAIPLDGKTVVYGSKLLTISPSKADIEALKSALGD